MRPGIIGHDDRVIVDSSAWPWQAIGRLNRGGSFCTATLIAPAAVLTARHCVWDPRTGQMVAPTELHFLAGYRRGEYVAHGIGARIETPAADAPPNSRFEVKDLPALARDWAVIHLQAPLPVRPIPLGSLAPGVWASVMRAGYSQDRPHLLSIHRDCAVVDRVPEQPLLLTNCDATRGDSGSPLLQGEGDQIALVGITAAVADDGRHGASIVIDVAAFAAIRTR